VFLPQEEALQAGVDSLTVAAGLTASTFLASTTGLLATEQEPPEQEDCLFAKTPSTDSEPRAILAATTN